MRTIKFKAKRKGKEQWVSGDLAHSLDGNLNILGFVEEEGKIGFTGAHQIDPYTVCQFTGFLDKHGKPKGNACYGSYNIETYSKEMTTEKYPISVLQFDKEKKLDMHPTQKPVALIQYLIRTYSNEGDTILDNCMGSGTTAIAAIREKRNFIGFELNKEYYDKACKRIKLEQAQLTLF